MLELATRGLFSGLVRLGLPSCGEDPARKLGWRRWYGYRPDGTVLGVAFSARVAVMPTVRSCSQVDAPRDPEVKTIARRQRGVRSTAGSPARLVQDTAGQATDSTADSVKVTVTGLVVSPRLVTTI